MQKVHLDLNSKLETVLMFPESRTALEKVLPEMAVLLEKQPSVQGFSLRRIVEYAKGAITQEQSEQLNAALGTLTIEAPEGIVPGETYSSDFPKTDAGAESKTGMMPYTSFAPGQIWRDTEGKRIQAHGGAIWYEDGWYYWYGENKDHTDGKTDIWTWGIRCYRSKDLYNWEDLGLIIQPDLANPKSGLYPENYLDRPHIVKCSSSDKYICWAKLSGDIGAFIILEADRLTGPYTIIHDRYRPFDMEAGDFDIIISKEDGKAYLFEDGNHNGIYGIRLSDDYSSALEIVSRQYTGLHAPFCREGVTVFSEENKYYMLTSGMTGYVPNRSDAAISENLRKPFLSIGDPHVNDASHASFNSQITDVLHIENRKNAGGSDLLIAMADRWVPDYIMDGRKSEMYERVTAMHFDPEHYHAAEEELQEYMQSPMLESADTSKSDYVWLPMTMEGGKPRIRWYDEWRIDLYEKGCR